MTHDAWRNYRKWLCDYPELGFRLDVSRMDLADDALERMGPPLQRAFDEMEKLEAGAIANPDEGRQVGHYWLRTPEICPDLETRQAIDATRQSIATFADDVHSGKIGPARADRFEHLLVVGIGGSALGPQFVAQALGSLNDRMTPHFLDNTDPDGIDRVLRGLGQDLERTLTIVISKSGSTPETRNGMLEATAAYAEAGLAFGAHAVAITQEGSQLDRHAETHEFLARFPMWDWVGGRTSQTSAVGLLPAALQGIDIDGLLRGAAAMDRATRIRSIGKNPAALLALAWYDVGEGRGAKDMVILPYKDRLSLLSRYLQQLVMESLGKERDLAGNVVHQGIAVYGNKGSTDQHAYVQQLRDGLANFFVNFVEVLKDRDGTDLEVDDGVVSGDYLQGFLLGTRQALHENGRRSLTVTLAEVDAQAVGMLIALYERAVGLYATLINVNAYHQPGVEAGKKAAAGLLELQQQVLVALEPFGSAGASCTEIAGNLDRTEAIEAVFMILERLSANPDRGVERTAGETPFDATYRRVQTG